MVSLESAAQFIKSFEINLSKVLTSSELEVSGVLVRLLRVFRDLFVFQSIEYNSSRLEWVEIYSGQQWTEVGQDKPVWFLFSNEDGKMGAMFHLDIEYPTSPLYSPSWVLKIETRSAATFQCERFQESWCFKTRPFVEINKHLSGQFWTRKWITSPFIWLHVVLIAAATF